MNAYQETFFKKYGALQFLSGFGLILLLGFWLLSVGFVHVLGLGGIILLLLIPAGMVLMMYLWAKPKTAIWGSLIMGFLISGLGRYVAAPWGLSIDIFLFLAVLFVAINPAIVKNWKHAKNDIVLFSLVWMGYLGLEIFNPAGNGFEAWFYAMRGIGFYQVMAVPLVYLLFREEKDFQLFIKILIVFSLLGTMWGFKQQIFGVDQAEYRWLWDENHHEEHILHGVLRVFSFYSDAGQFGASQAMMSMLMGILAFGPFSTWKRIGYAVLGVIFFLGFAISGTRGALAVPLFGGLAYLFCTRNFKVLIAGLGAMVTVFIILKYTFLFQGVEQVRRMRTALDPENPSLQVRLDNQRTFGRYLADKPFGGGVGTAGFWGARFNPNSLMANTATDSWYVKIWAETGFVGLAIHLSFLGYVIGKGGYLSMNIPNKKHRAYAMAVFSCIVGVVFSSYGNQVFGQMPTGMVMNLAIPFLFLIPEWSKKQEK
ncbi:O-antigen ligase family protein [Algoriphagus namhaensis]|uniref:O-antigen ligase family protein n=1 Tax=Algoriphagus namhaensis TaxID=915353 RepID=A0ABV8APY3_9BACT